MNWKGGGQGSVSQEAHTLHKNSTEAPRDAGRQRADLTHKLFESYATQDQNRRNVTRRTRPGDETETIRAEKITYCVKKASKSDLFTLEGHRSIAINFTARKDSHAQAESKNDYHFLLNKRPKNRTNPEYLSLTSPQRVSKRNTLAIEWGIKKATQPCTKNAGTNK